MTRGLSHPRDRAQVSRASIEIVARACSNALHKYFAPRFDAMKTRLPTLSFPSR